MITVLAAWHRVAIIALLVVPLVIVILLMSPGLVVLPFSEKGREFILKLIDKGVQWVKALSNAAAKSG
ncbi:hypothetical protein ABZV14_05710 [Streptosporangium canum]|uniref:hypothetical protein n=1 Tax=Streptosporangium canum TaxID=324952 RepID=UPI0033B6C9E2